MYIRNGFIERNDLLVRRKPNGERKSEREDAINLFIKPPQLVAVFYRQFSRTQLRPRDE